MADNKNIQDGRDRSKVDANDSNELSYLQEKFGAGREQVRAAVEAVGSDRDKVEAYLQKK